jgi:sulfur carrier protein
MMQDIRQERSLLPLAFQSRPPMTMNGTIRASQSPERGATTQIFVNGEGTQTHARTLADLLSELGYGDAKVATALNGDFVPARLRNKTPLQPGDRIEVVAPRQGG